MLYTLAAAATATGLTRTTILRAIKDGKIFAFKDELGEWRVEPAELHRVFPPVSRLSAGPESAPRYSRADVEALTTQIEALLKSAGDRLRKQFDDVRRDRDDGARDPHADRFELADQEKRLA
jgi:hypothetical protein